MSTDDRLRKSILALCPFLEECVRAAEDLLGPRDEQWDVPGLRVRTDGKTGPYTDTSSFPRLLVFLPQACLFKKGLTEARWHVAHESIHVLDPHSNPTNYLEEGLATWFQNDRVKEYEGCRYDPWAEAQKRVEPWLDVLPRGLKRFRERQRRLRLKGVTSTKIGDIRFEVLRRYCTELDERGESLVRPFPKDPNPTKSLA